MTRLPARSSLPFRTTACPCVGRSPRPGEAPGRRSQPPTRETPVAPLVRCPTMKSPPHRVNGRGRAHHLTRGDEVTQRTCSIERCERPHAARGWCILHYSRWKRCGSLGEAVFQRLTPVERFFSFVALHGSCWIWTGHCTSNGYGTFFDRRTIKAHRWAYEHWVGPIPDGLVLDHFACDTPPCVNPMHVRPVTRRENTLRGDGPAAQNLAKTHCKRGHPFDEANTLHRQDGRQCRVCVNVQQARRRAQR